MLNEFPTFSETVKTIKLLSFGKATGSDAIPAEIYKAEGTPIVKKMTELFHIIWRKEAIPQEFKVASIIHLFKRKENPHLCHNHRGISLLPITGRVLARVLHNRLNQHNEQSGLLPESQCGFRMDRGTIDMIFTARQSVVRVFDKYGEVWLSDQVHNNGEAVPRWYACTGPKMMVSFLIHSL